LIKEGGFYIHELLRLKSCVERDKECEKLPITLNEVQIYPDPPSDLLHIELTIDENTYSEYLSSFLVYTPSGSYGYAKNLGGKILNPLADEIGLVAGAPYEGIFKELKSFTVDGGSKIRIEIHQDASLSVDSKKVERRKPLKLLGEGDRVRIEKGKPLKLVVFDEKWWEE
jgi:NAD kinase